MSAGAGEAAAGTRHALMRGPDLYRDNIFRITGLPVDATPRMISRQREKFRLAFVAGTAPPSVQGPFRLDPPPSEDAVQAAFEGFRDPERRLVDELFWFWRPGQPEYPSAADPTDVDTEHDRAVAAHCTALDFEHLSRQRPLTGEERARRDAGWAVAARRWAALDELPDLWVRLRERVGEIDDRRLTVEAVDDILDEVPMGFVAIHAQLALDLTQRDASEAARHRTLIDEFVQAAGLDAARVDATLRAVVAPALRRIETTCQKARAAAEQDRPNGCAPGTRALAQLRAALETVGAVLTPSHPTIRAARDEVASTLNVCAVYQSNITELTDRNATASFAAVLDLLKQAQQLACLATTTNQINNNIELVEELQDSVQRQGAPSRSAPPRSAPSRSTPQRTTPPISATTADPRMGREIFAELRKNTRGPWPYIDRLCREGRPDRAHDALALWAYYLAKDPAVTRQAATLLAKPAPFVARMKRIPRRAMLLGCGIDLRSSRSINTTEFTVVQYLTLFLIPLIPIAAYVATHYPPRRADYLGKAPLGMGLRYWRKLLTVTGVLALIVLMFDGSAIFFALVYLLALRIGIQVYKCMRLYQDIKESMAR
ncbi:MAG: hypothetical protein ACRDRV_00625 [Pseudonocardiaceae bacterium]